MRQINSNQGGLQSTGMLVNELKQKFKVEKTKQEIPISSYMTTSIPIENIKKICNKLEMTTPSLIAEIKVKKNSANVVENTLVTVHSDIKNEKVWINQRQKQFVLIDGIKRDEIDMAFNENNQTQQSMAHLFVANKPKLSESRVIKEQQNKINVKTAITVDEKVSDKPIPPRRIGSAAKILSTQKEVVPIFNADKPLPATPTIHNKLTVKTKIESILQKDISSVDASKEFNRLEKETFNLVKNRTIQYITHKKLPETTGSYFKKYNDYNSEGGVVGQRLNDIFTAKDSQVVIKGANGKEIGLPANLLSIDNEPLAYRCQYPLSDEESLENHFRMIVDKKVPVLVVLASDKDINAGANKLPSYFNQVGQKQKVGKFTIESKLLATKQCGEMTVKNYKMTVKYLENGHKKKHSLLVNHVVNWPDKTTVSASDIQILANETNKMLKLKLRSKIVSWFSRTNSLKNNINVPLIHCRAGVGRTGLLAGTMQLMKKNKSRSASDITLEMRKTGTQNMVQIPDQLQTLMAVEKSIRTHNS